MKQRKNMENETNRKAGLSLQEFCDMDQLYRLLDNWSKKDNVQPQQPVQNAAWFCPNCGTQNTSRFCTGCGTPKP